MSAKWGKDCLQKLEVNVEPPPNGENWTDVLYSLYKPVENRHRSMAIQLYVYALPLLASLALGPQCCLTYLVIEISRNCWAISSILESGKRQYVCGEHPFFTFVASTHPYATLAYVVVSSLSQAKVLSHIIDGFEPIDEKAHETLDINSNLDPPLKVKVKGGIGVEMRHWMRTARYAPLAVAFPLLYVAYLMFHSRLTRPVAPYDKVTLAMDALGIVIEESGKEEIKKEEGKNTRTELIERAIIPGEEENVAVGELNVSTNDNNMKEEDGSETESVDEAPIEIATVGNTSSMIDIGSWEDINKEERNKKFLTIPVADEDHVQVFAHPGSGKTREIATRYRGIITGPTRVVCKSAAEAFKDKEIPVDLKIAGGDKGRKHDTVVIPHASLLRQLDTVEGETIVMDETHFENLDTQLLLKILRYLASMGRVKLIEMTATGYNIKTGKQVIARESNCEIEDIELPANIREDELQDIIKKERAKGSRIMVFKPNVTSVQGENVHNLNRGTFDKVYEKVKNPPPGTVIYSTNIAECGANFNLDVVIDLQQQIRPTANSNDDVELKRTACTIPAATQRRGRVGRDRAGKYYYVNRARGYTDPLIEAEAKELFELFKGNKHHRAFAWLQTEIDTLRMIKFCCDKHFKMVPADTLRKRVDSFRLQHPDKNIDARCPDVEKALIKFADGPCTSDRYKVLQREIGLSHAHERTQGYPD